MANIYYTGKATAVAQVTTVQVTAYDAATTYILTVGGVAIVSVAGSVDVNTTAAAINTAWNLSVHPYATVVTGTVSTDTVTLTGATEGVPFTVVSSKTGGTGTIGAATEATAPTGPNHWDEATNWSAGAVPTTSDNATVDDAFYIAWGLGAVAYKSLRITNKSKRTGLNSREFATSSDARTTVSTVPEYRTVYLTVTSLGTNPYTHIGDSEGPGNVRNIERCMIDLGSTAQDCIVFGTAKTPSETGWPAVRIKANNSSTDIYVQSAQAGVGVASDSDSETSTIGDIACSDPTTASKVYISDGVTLTNAYSDGGTWIVRAGATVTLIRIGSPAIVTTRGDYTATTLTNNGGTVYLEHIKTGAACVTNLNHNAGITDGTRLTIARTITTTTIARDASTGKYIGTFKLPDSVTLTNAPAGTGGTELTLGG